MTRREMVAAATAARAFAQQQQDATFTTGIKVVNITAVVTEKTSGRLVTDLTKDDFALDDERVPQPIRYFASGSTLPLTMGLVVDTSGSQEQLLGAQREAAAVFAERMVRDGQDSVFVLKFDRYVSLVQDLTQSKARVKKSIGALRPSPAPENARFNLEAAHTSRLFDAIQTACERYFPGSTGRRALVVLSDGADTGFAGAINRAVEAAIRQEAVIFSICYRDPLATNPALLPEEPVRPRAGVRNLPEGVAMSGRDNMIKLALETGGAFFDVTDETPVGQVFRLVGEELLSQYSIGFIPSEGGRGRFRRVRLSVRKPGYEVRSRAGYYPDSK